MNRLTIILLSLFQVLTCYAQFYDAGQDPASIKWQQINTPNVRVIFPLGFDSAANRLANTFDYVSGPDAESLKCKPRKFSVVLHNHSSYSNGFVTIAPRRMELYTTPEQNFTAQDWLSELAIHEYRHIVQTSKVNKGVIRILYPFFGQISSGLGAAMMPLWFVEGDAVYSETMLTNSGRGRTGVFTTQIKSILRENRRIYSFEKMIHGSYRNYVPNHYQTGYFMVSSIRKKYGPEVFEKNINFLARNPYIPFSFSRSLKLQTGKTARGLFKETFKDLKTTLSNDNRIYNNYPPFTTYQPRNFTSYNYPQQINDNTILAVKSGINDITRFVYLFKDGSEQVLFTPGSYSQTRISGADEKIAWTEEIPDTRWGNRSYSCLKLFDIKTNSLQWISKKTRYFSAALSSDSRQVATVEVTLENKPYLVILNTENKKIIAHSPSPDNLMISDPVFSGDNQSVVAVISGDRGKAIYRYRISSEKWEQITPFSFYNLSCPVVWNKYIVFSSDYNGTNNLYAWNDSNQTVYKITSSENGAFEPFLSTKDSVLFFPEYSHRGYAVKTVSTFPKRWIPYQIPGVYTDLLIQAGTQAEKFNFQDSVNSNPLLLSRINPAKPYSRLLHLIHPHSWTPFVNLNSNSYGLENLDNLIGLTIYSQDLLSTCVSSVSSYYNNGQWLFQPRFTYKGWFPVLDFSADYGGYIPYTKRFNKTAPSEYGYLKFNSLIYAPFNLTRGKQINNISPLLEINHSNRRLFNTSDSAYHKGLTMAAIGLSYYSYLKTSLRDIAPKFGFSLIAKFIYNPFDQDQFGWLSFIKPRIYLPGLFPHHSLQIAGAYQYQTPRIYTFANQVSFVRGYDYTDEFSENLAAVWIDYHFPIAYPDFAAGPIFYIKRIRADVFVDYAQNRYRSNSKWEIKHYKNAGVDILFDFHLLHIYFPLTLGPRLIFKPEKQSFANQFVFRTDFNF